MHTSACFLLRVWRRPFQVSWEKHPICKHKHTHRIGWQDSQPSVPAGITKPQLLGLRLVPIFCRLGIRTQEVLVVTQMCQSLHQWAAKTPIH